MSDSFTRIGNALQAFLGKAGLGHVLYEAKLRDKWSDIMGAKAAELTELESLKDWKLRVRVSHPAWRQELHFQREAILERANAVLGGKWIKELILY